MKWQELLKKRLSLLLVAGFVLMTASASYAGTITVNTRDDANAAIFGQWQLYNGAGSPARSGGAPIGWKNSGDSIASASGTYTIKFGNIPGYTKPADISHNFTATTTYGFANGAKYVRDLDFGTRTGFYNRTKSLKVNITPNIATVFNAGPGGAKWSLDGGLTKFESGQTVSAPTSYKITFYDASSSCCSPTFQTNNWRKPHSVTGNFAQAASNTANGVTGSGIASDPYVITRPYTHAPSDFADDGLSDILFRHTSSGLLYVWESAAQNSAGYSALSLNAAGYLSQDPTAGASPGTLVTQADFNGDGKADLLFQNTSDRSLTVWIMDGTSAGHVSHANTINYALGASTFVGGAADFNGDGLAEILVVDHSASTMQPKILSFTHGNFLCGSNTQACTAGVFKTLTTTPTESNVKKVDGTTNLTLPNSGSLAYSATAGWHVAALADIDGDGFSDILWRSKTNGQVSIWNMKGANGNVRKSLGTLTPSLGAYSNVASAAVVGTSTRPRVDGTMTGWHISGTGDFNGDGYTDLLLRNGTTGEVAVWLLKGQPTGTVVSKVANGANTAVLYPTAVAPSSTAADTSRGSGSLVDSDGVVIRVGGFTTTSGWSVEGVGEFGTGGSSYSHAADILWRYLGTGHTYVMEMHGRSAVGYGFTEVYPGAVSTWGLQPIRTVPVAH